MSYVMLSRIGIFLKYHILQLLVASAYDIKWATKCLDK